MAMHCCKANRECDGCMRCQESSTRMYCPNPDCQHPLDYVEQVYKLGGEVIGCDYCITASLAEDELL